MARSAPRELGMRTCRKCKVRKPLAEFNPQAARFCQQCVDAKSEPTTKAMRNRARNRAYVDLAGRHREEFAELYRRQIAITKAERDLEDMLRGEDQP